MRFFRNRVFPNRNNRGSALIEFSVLGVPVLFVTISIISISLDMWEFHNLAYATDGTARYITMHGATCSANSNNCAITVGNIATYFKGLGSALDGSTAILKLTDASGTTTTCNPVNTCTSSSTVFPSASNNYNAVGNDITVKATYILKDPGGMFWPPNTDRSGDYTVGAMSRQRILF